MVKKPGRVLLIFAIFAILFVSTFHQSNVSLLDLSTGKVPTDFEIYTPFYLYLIEPLVGISDYFLSFYNIKCQLLSWVLWIFSFCVIIGVLYKKPIWKIPIIYFLSILWFIVLITFVLFFSIPKYYLKVKDPQSNLLLDFHSHSYYSHDGIPSPQEVAFWHKKNNFNAFYLTDHYKNHAYQIRTAPVALPGEEIRDSPRNHLLILGMDISLPKELAGKNTAEITRFVHKNDGAIIVAHWWGQKASKLEELYNAGVDGFEVYGHEIKPIDKKTQAELIEFCQRKKLVPVAGTNYHGWGARCDLWNVVKIENWQKYTSRELNRKIIELIRNKAINMFRVLIIVKPHTPKEVIFFEPFVGMFYYFLSLNLYQMLVWFIWIFCVYKLTKFEFFRRNIHITYFAVATGFFSFAAWQLSKWYSIRNIVGLQVVNNEILIVISKTYLVLSVIFFLTGYIKLKTSRQDRLQ
ncbi:MAG: hypothetical protein QME68_01435 [Elusimicrobiota bacterium]|nr:hypothetical protein [Elusimicrobiota bacterium]